MIYCFKRIVCGNYLGWVDDLLFKREERGKRVVFVFICLLVIVFESYFCGIGGVIWLG